MNRIAVFAALVLALGAAACGDSPTAPTSTPAFSQTDLRVGTGTEATNGRLAQVIYTGWLYDPGRPESKGLRFETNVGGNPFEFLLGVGEVIEGWDRGVNGMRVGGLRRLTIPPSLAYGEVRNGPIPPYSALVFEVELVGVADLDDGGNE
ncbi:MAG TPA: FKBP-type peptidyl-prolyl cis-trans isomerase [Longimicrobiaceae bacterium]|nr:FKBP-type peptidyl-prolyl cis-trans isomerase [Longimicrobiaceae bacterium]